MVELCLVIGFVAVLVTASVWADRRFRRAARLPMQWSLTGEVVWSAPRRIALAFTPALAAIILGAIAVLVFISGAPRPGQEGMGPLVVLMVGLVFAGIHALHLGLIEKSLSSGV